MVASRWCRKICHHNSGWRTRPLVVGWLRLFLARAGPRHGPKLTGYMPFIWLCVSLWSQPPYKRKGRNTFSPYKNVFFSTMIIQRLSNTDCRSGCSCQAASMISGAGVLLAHESHGSKKNLIGTPEIGQCALGNLSTDMASKYKVLFVNMEGISRDISWYIYLKLIVKTFK